MGSKYYTLLSNLDCINVSCHVVYVLSVDARPRALVRPVEARRAHLVLYWYFIRNVSPHVHGRTNEHTPKSIILRPETHVRAPINLSVDADPTVQSTVHPGARVGRNLSHHRIKKNQIKSKNYYFY